MDDNEFDSHNFSPPVYKVNPTDLLNCAHWNVRGLNNPAKLHSILNYYLSSRFSMLALTETKLSFSSARYILKSESATYNFTTYWSCHSTSPASAGVGLILDNALAKYVQKVLPWNGRVLSIDLFCHDLKWRIIVAYPPPYSANNKDELFEVQKYLIDLLESSRHDNFEVFLLGDLNCSIDNRFSSSAKNL
ncbi:hypothetical protein RhiirC2_801636, partial [Rhizophagus irregularis]